MRYPKECPVFEVVHVNKNENGGKTDGTPLRVGDVFECYPTEYQSPYRLRGANPYPFIGGVPLRTREVRPLTTAAREMLALVTRE